MLSTRNLSLPKKVKGKQILSQKWEESSVFGVALPDIWPTSAAMSHLHVIAVGSLDIWPKNTSKKRTKELGGNNTTHQVTATPTSGTCTKEEQENSALSRIVFM